MNRSWINVLLPRLFSETFVNKVLYHIKFSTPVSYCVLSFVLLFRRLPQVYLLTLQLNLLFIVFKVFLNFPVYGFRDAVSSPILR